MKIKLQGKDSKVDLADVSFAAAYNEPLVHQVVTAYLAGGRSGTKAQKNRAQVRGGGAKPWNQKGTGAFIQRRPVGIGPVASAGVEVEPVSDTGMGIN